MKLSLMLGSRSRTNSPASSAPSSPASSSSTSPTFSQKKIRLPKPHLGRSHSKRTRERHDAAVPHEIVEASTPSSKSPACLTSNAFAGKGKELLVVGEPFAAARQLGKLSERGMHEIEQVFAQFDANGDGKISSEELQAVLASLGDEPTREEAELMVREVDTDGDGFINLQEFVDMNRACLRQAAAEEEIAAAFAVFDLDKNGHITAEELQAVLRRLGGSMGQRASTEECRRMIRGVDRKGVGHVDLDDFKRMMTPLTF